MFGDIEFSNNKEYIKAELESIITQQIIIAQLSKGISYADTNEMANYERTFVFKKLIELKKEENIAREKAYHEARQK